ncbi:MAG: hypothetical protein ACKOJF_31620, partial [Planctomycetaceae bacterium]
MSVCMSSTPLLVRATGPGTPSRNQGFNWRGGALFDRVVAPGDRPALGSREGGAGVAAAGSSACPGSVSWAARAGGASSS